jgi:hypothetical protein
MERSNVALKPLWLFGTLVYACIPRYFEASQQCWQSPRWHAAILGRTQFARSTLLGFLPLFRQAVLVDACQAAGGGFAVQFRQAVGWAERSEPHQ